MPAAPAPSGTPSTYSYTQPFFGSVMSLESRMARDGVHYEGELPFVTTIDG
jgi:hypothetical protein